MNGKIEGNFSIRPQQVAVPHDELINGQCEQLLDRSSLRRSLAHPESGNIRGAVRRNGDVYDGMLESHRVKAELGAQKRDHFQMRHQAVRMRQRNVSWTFL